jgi:CheY-like chemotaxis protein
MNTNYSNYPILIVEDNENDIMLIQRAFKKLNIINPIIILKNGEQAIDFFREAKVSNQNSLPIIILLDLKLPKKSGFEVLEYIKNSKTIKRIPIIILTSSSEYSDVNKAYDLGANSYLRKPVSFEELLNIIKSIGYYWLTLNHKPEVNY